MEKITEVVKTETKVDIQKLDADDIQHQSKLVERQLERLKWMIEN